MANCSTADVEITVKKVGKELINYIDKTNRNAEYGIAYETNNAEPDENGDTTIYSGATGRWSYATNLEGYFEPTKVQQWLGVGADYSWMEDKEKKEQYARQSLENLIAFKQLTEAIEKTGGSIEIHYKDMEGGNCFIVEGWAEFGLDDDKKLAFTLNEEGHDYDVSTYMSVFEENDLYEAIDLMHGDEVADAYFEAVKEEDRSSANFDEWYESYEY